MRGASIFCIGVLTVWCAMLFMPAMLHAQPWSLVRTLDEGLVPEGSRVAVELDGDLLFIAISGPDGGTVIAHQKDQGGLDQWGVVGTLHRDDPWFGGSIAIHGDRLAVGSPGTDGAGPFTGEVRLYSIDVQPGQDVLQPLGVIALDDATSNDRFGYSVLWIGDTLAVSAVGRASARSLGKVLLFTLNGGVATWTGSITPPVQELQVPFIRWFGVSIAHAGDRLAIAAPFTGFETSRPKQNIGSLALYQRDLSSPSGWSLDTSWADTRVDTAVACSFQRMELGRWGLAFSGSDLIMDNATPYTGSAGTELEPWLFPDLVAACATCGLRVVPNTDGHWDLSDPSAIDPEGNGFLRGARGWAVFDDALCVEWYDPQNDVWTTSVHRRDQGGADAWGVQQSVPATDASCDGLSGPLVLDAAHLARSTQRRGSDCGVPDGSVRIGVEIFSH